MDTKKRNQSELFMAMAAFDEGNPMRIQHFLKVWGFAKIIGELEGLSEQEQHILETASLVHDIGIKVCMQKYGRCSGNLQELEGPPLAEAMLEKLGYDKETVQRVSYLVGHHHTYKNVDGRDYQILLEADFLVNSYESKESPQAIKAFCKNVFRTSAGIQMLRIQSGIEDL